MLHAREYAVDAKRMARHGVPKDRIEIHWGEAQTIYDFEHLRENQLPVVQRNE